MRNSKRGMPSQHAEQLGHKSSRNNAVIGLYTSDNASGVSGSVSSAHALWYNAIVKKYE